MLTDQRASNRGEPEEDAAQPLATGNSDERDEEESHTEGDRAVLSPTTAIDDPLKWLISTIPGGMLKTAQTVLKRIDPNNRELGDALVLAIESGRGKIVRDLAACEGAAHKLPTALCLLQTPPSEFDKPWRGTDRHTTYEELAGQLACRTALSLDQEGASDLQTAIEFMIKKWELHAFLLLQNQVILDLVNRAQLLVVATSLLVKNAAVANLLIGKGVSNLLPVLKILQGYATLQRYGWNEPGYEGVRASLIAAIAAKPGNISTQDRAVLITVIENIIKSPEGQRAAELRQLLMNNAEIAGLPELPQFLMLALQHWNGKVAQSLAMTGMRGLVGALRWLQNHYSSFGIAVQNYVMSTWTTSGWLETYQCIAAVLARNWSAVPAEFDRNTLTGRNVVERTITLEAQEATDLLFALRYMIDRGEPEALVILGGGEGSAVKRFTSDQLSAELNNAMDKGNGDAAIALIRAGANGIVGHLRRLITNFVQAVWASQSYPTVLQVFLDALVPRDSQLSEELEEQPTLIGLLTGLVEASEKAAVSQFISHEGVKQRLSLDERLQLFRAALVSNQAEIVQQLLQGQSFECQCRALKIAHAEYVRSMAETGMLHESVMRDLCLKLIHEILKGPNLFSGLKVEEQLLLREVLELLMSLDVVDTLSILKSGPEPAVQHMSPANRSLLLRHSLVKRAGTEALALIAAGSEGSNDHLVYLVSETKEREWQSAGYSEVRDALLGILQPNDELSPELNDQQKFLKLLEALIRGKEKEGFFHFISRRSTHSRLKPEERIGLIRVAFEVAQPEMVTGLLAGQPIGLYLRVLVIAQVDFGFRKDSAKLILYRDFYDDLIRMSLENEVAYRDYLPEDEPFLTKAVVCLVGDKDPKALLFLSQEHIYSRFNFEWILRAAALMLNGKVVEIILGETNGTALLLRPAKFSEKISLGCLIEICILVQAMLLQKPDPTNNLDVDSIKGQALGIYQTILAGLFRVISQQGASFFSGGEAATNKSTYISLLEQSVRLNESENLSKLLNVVGFLQPADIEHFLNIALTFSELNAAAVLRKRVPHRTIDVLLAIQVVSGKKQSPTDSICAQYRVLLQQISSVLQFLPKDEQSVRRLCDVLRFVAEHEPEKEADLFSLFAINELHTYLGQMINALVQEIKQLGNDQLTVKLVARVSESVLSSDNQTILRKIFRKAARRDDEALMLCCLQSIDDFTRLGLTEKGDNSPLVIAVAHNAVKVTTLLLTEGAFLGQDFEAAWVKEQEKTGKGLIGTVLSWSAPSLPDDLRQKLKAKAAALINTIQLDGLSDDDGEADLTDAHRAKMDHAT